MSSRDKKCKSFDNGYILRSKPKFVWIIDEFGDKCETFGEYILSPEFSYGSKMEISWKLQIYPFGKKKEDDSYLSLNVVSQSNVNVRTSIQIRIENIPDLKNLTTMEFIFGKNRVAGFERFVSRQEILEKLKDADEVVHVSCELYDITLVDNILSDISNPKLNALNHIGQLYTNKTFCDATIKVDGKEFKVHKAILAARSKVFAAMFEHDMIEKRKSLVKIQDINHEVFEALLKFLYTGEVETKEMSKELLMAADKYEIFDLKDICIVSLYNRLDAGNAVDLLMYSKFHNLSELASNVMDFIAKNFKNIANKPSFKSVEESPQLLMELLFKMDSIPKEKNHSSSDESSETEESEMIVD